MRAAKRFACCLAMASAVLTANAWAADDNPAGERPTFFKDVLPILQQNCQICHRPGGTDMGGMIAPMSLVTYEEARPWAKSIAKETASRAMPPWHASPVHHGVFANERTLTDAEIATLVRWSETGAAMGNAADAPPPVTFPEGRGYAFGEPDLVVKMPEKYFIADDVEDLYIDFETTISEEDLPEPRWVKAHQVIAGSDAVHHVISSLGSLVPGGDARVYREGYGRLVKPGEKVRFQMHYHKEPGPGTGRYDQTEVGLKFYPAGYQPKYKFDGDPMGNFRFRIPPGDPNYKAESEFTFDRDARLVSFMPHMHLRGKAVKIMAHYPDGSEELLLDVPKYDFNWQTTYEYKEYKPVPKGTRLHMTAWWDNSPENPNNPDPTKEVRWGKPTTDEMMFAWMRYTDPVEGAGDVGEGDNAVEEGDATNVAIEGPGL